VGSGIRVGVAVGKDVGVTVGKGVWVRLELVDATTASVTATCRVGFVVTSVGKDVGMGSAVVDCRMT